MQENHFINELKVVYQDLSLSTIDQLKVLYRSDVVFVDPINLIEGRDVMLQHFRSSYENVLNCQFDFDSESEIILEDQAFLSWVMTITHKSLNSKKPITVSGASHLKFNDGIYYHRDWFDVGEMVYENLPLFGSITRLVKSKLHAENN